ncbi:hypothetical protein E3J74_07195 [Candidatus Bathyarchaeota archaeon]|nr:MAG: hypothetical protein E3J74_07195 [Candidatus Bathyarchaeota archaeon]
MSRKIIIKNRTSVYRLRPEEIHGVKVIKITHKMKAEFYNPSSKREPLFWERTICGGETSSVDIPESLKGISPTIDPEDVYSFRELLIDGKPRSFKKNIHYKNPDQVGMHITCNIIAEPKTTYHVSTLDEGLYAYNDSIEEEVRSSLERAVIIVEKIANPVNLRFSANVFGENASLNIIEDSSKVYCVEMLDPTGFSVHWRKARTLERISGRIPFDRVRISACVTFAFLLAALTTLIIAQKNIMLLPIVPFNIILALLALIYAFSPEHAREIINALKEIYRAFRK